MSVRAIPEAFLPLRDPYRHYALYGGRGSAKSHTVGGELADKGNQRGLKIACGRQFQNSINESVKELIEQKIAEQGLNDNYRILDREIRHVSNGTKFIFLGLDRNPDSQKSLEGVDIFWGEEAHTFNEKSLEIIIPTIRKPGSSMIWTWNPRYATDPVDNMFRGGEPPERSFVREVSYLDNPWFFSGELATEMRFHRKRFPKRFKHVWLGAYDENGDAQIFQNWKIGRIEIPANVYPRIGMDFGFGSDPHAVMKIYILRELGILYIAQESVGEASLRELPTFVERVSETKKWPIIADSGMPGVIEYLGSKGFTIYGARKGKGSVETGINWLQGWDIIIDPECVHMQEEARRYFWKLDKGGKPMPEPVDKFNHCWDAIRYALEDEITIIDPNDTDQGSMKVKF